MIVDTIFSDQLYENYLRGMRDREKQICSNIIDRIVRYPAPPYRSNDTSFKRKPWCYFGTIIKQVIGSNEPEIVWHWYDVGTILKKVDFYDCLRAMEDMLTHLNEIEKARVCEIKRPKPLGTVSGNGPRKGVSNVH